MMSCGWLGWVFAELVGVLMSDCGGLVVMGRVGWKVG